MLKTIIFPKDLSKLNKKGLPEPQYEEPAQENFLKREKYTNIVDKAFISGLNPNLTLEKTTIGRVFAPGPLVKLATTKSSKERVKANNHPEIIEGKIIGNVIFLNIL